MALAALEAPARRLEPIALGGRAGTVAHGGVAVSRYEVRYIGSGDTDHAALERFIGRYEVALARRLDREEQVATRALYAAHDCRTSRLAVQAFLGRN
mgnify:FL=1